MNVIKTWRVQSLDYKPQVFDLEKVVSAATLRLEGTDGDHTDSIFVTVDLPPPAGDFTPFDQLSEPEVLDWCFKQMGKQQVDAYEADITAKIAALQNPTEQTNNLPWTQAA